MYLLDILQNLYELLNIFYNIELQNKLEFFFYAFQKLFLQLFNLKDKFFLLVDVNLFRQQKRKLRI